MQSQREIKENLFIRDNTDDRKICFEIIIIIIIHVIFERKNL